MSGPMSMEDYHASQKIKDDMIWIQTAMDTLYPVRCYGRDPEEVAALAAKDIGLPVKVVKEKHEDSKSK